MRRASNLHKISAAFCLAAGVLGTQTAHAFDSENAVPLTVFSENRQTSIEAVAIRLHGRDVTISTRLHNESDRAQATAFYAYTPIFNQLGAGEEHSDKRFADLRVGIQGKPASIKKLSRAYFLGKDITDDLVKAGMDPTPELEAPASKLERLPKVQGQHPIDWNGLTVYTWTDAIAPGARSTQEIRYRDLPQFGLNDLASDHFSRQVRQHCGDPAKVIAIVRKNDPQAEQVIVERHEIGLAFMAQREVALEVTQPVTNWLGGRPLISLVCGIDNPDLRADVKGVLQAADQTVHVLTISLVGTAAR
jgi:hypothetical protein